MQLVSFLSKLQQTSFVVAKSSWGWNVFSFVVPDLHTKHLHFGSYMYDEFGRNLKLDFALRALSCFLRKSVMQSVKASKPKKNICRSILLRDCMGFA